MKTNSILELSLHNFDADNPTPRLPIIICLETSSSMNGEPIDFLNDALKNFYKSISDNVYAKYATEICVVSFSDKTNIESGFKLVDDRTSVNLFASGKPCMGQAIHKSIELISERIGIYTSTGTPYFQPWLIILSSNKDSTESNDVIQSALKKCNDLEINGKLVVFPVGIEKDANYQLLNKFSARQRAYKINHHKFDLFFEWLSKSISDVSLTKTGDTINLPTATISTWGEL
ncbi:MAG: VWA domain-containing protein [bacterium]